MRYINLFEDFIVERKTFKSLNMRALLNFIKGIKSGDLKYYFISFRSNEFVTMINPNNGFNTPTGTYSYPLYTYINHMKEFDKYYDEHNVDKFLLDTFPFTGFETPNFINLYKVKKNILDNNILNTTMTKSQVINVWNKKLKGKNEIIDKYMKKYLLSDDMKFIAEFNQEFNKLPKKFSILKSPLNVLYYLLLSVFNKNGIGRFCYKNGINGFIDYAIPKPADIKFGFGKSILVKHKKNPKQISEIAMIHHSEPTQAVFFGGRNMYSEIESYIFNKREEPISLDNLEIDIKRDKNILIIKKYGVKSIKKLKVEREDGINKLNIDFNYTKDFLIINPEEMKGIDILSIKSCNNLDQLHRVLELIKPKRDIQIDILNYEADILTFPDNFKLRKITLNFGNDLIQENIWKEFRCNSRVVEIKRNNNIILKYSLHEKVYNQIIKNNISVDSVILDGYKKNRNEIII